VNRAPTHVWVVVDADGKPEEGWDHEEWRFRRTKAAAKQEARKRYQMTGIVHRVIKYLRDSSS
jgi:hypothetical protein